MLRVMRTNYFWRIDDALANRCTDWWICQHDIADLRLAYSVMAARPDFRPTFWVPGLRNPGSMDLDEIVRRLGGAEVRAQRTFAALPARCRWDQDLAPQRPLMGSYAIAVAVGMQPDELYLCGHDLFAGAEGQYDGGLSYNMRGAWQDTFAAEYRDNRHRNHTLRGDLAYIGAALAAYKGRVVCVGSELKRHFGDMFPRWRWLEE